MWKHPFPTETALPLEPSEKIFCDAEISSCSRCSCYPVVPPLHLLRTTRPGSSSTLRSRRSLRSLARCAATKRFSNILKINEKSINITTKRGKRRARDSRAEKDHLYVVYIDEIYLIPISAHTRNRYQIEFIEYTALHIYIYIYILYNIHIYRIDTKTQLRKLIYCVYR